MERRTWGACGMAVSMGLGLPGFAAAEPAERLPHQLVVHLDDRVGVPAADLDRVKADATQVFLDAGIEIVWIEERLHGPFRSARGAVAVLLVNSIPNPRRQAPGCVLGLAVPKLGTAYAYYDRIEAMSGTRPVDRRVMLGRVIAHELGHLLLPPGSHSAHGIMRADVDWGVENPPRFTREQVETLRARLLTQMAQR